MAEIIMGIDHGNGNMKGVHVNFPCGLVRYTSEPGRFMNEDILEYNGVYYTLSETRMPSVSYTHLTLPTTERV